jgi:hypothetical protein
LRPTLAYTTASLAPTVVTRAEDLKEDPSLDDFKRRFDAAGKRFQNRGLAEHSMYTKLTIVTILGDYIYIVGGHIGRTVGDDNKGQ